MKSSAKKRSKKDARVTRTRDRLGDALIELIEQQPFEQITVQEVLDRARVSRSTFYAHYTNKEDLFLEDVNDFWEYMATMLERTGESSERVAAVRELFAHASGAHQLKAALLAAGKVHDVLELGREHFARGIEQRLTRMQRPARASAQRLAMLSQMFAGALFSLLDRWLSGAIKETPQEMDDFFHETVWAVLGSASAGQSERGA